MLSHILASLILMPNPLPASVKKVVAELVDGNHRFVADQTKHLGQDQARRDELAKGQMPEAIILSCSDSRVPPEIVFDQGLGHFFVIRTAGEAIDFSAVASIEYAVAHFHPKVLLVLGHDYCGAIDATLKTPAGKSAGSPDLDRLVASLRPNVAGFKKEDDALVHPVKANVDAIAKALIHRSTIVRDAAHGNKMAILHGIYRLHTGAVEIW